MSFLLFRGGMPHPQIPPIPQIIFRQLRTAPGPPRRLSHSQAVPCAVLGPVDFFALRRWEATRAGVRVGDLCSDMAPPTFAHPSIVAHTHNLVNRKQQLLEPTTSRSGPPPGAPRAGGAGDSTMACCLAHRFASRINTSNSLPAWGDATLNLCGSISAKTANPCRVLW